MNVDAEMTGSRQDPHAQARAARQQPLLLHSMSVFREMFTVVFAHRPIKTVVEVGVESGQVSSIYTELGAERVYCVDPYPSDELRATLAKNPKLELVEKPAPAVLADLPPADLYVLDGDHNYAVLHGELSWITRNAPDAVIAFHDVLWPWSRRDLYYEPSLLADDQRHPHSDDGPTIWHDELTPAGFVGLGSFTVAEEAGGERNGVLTAIEDVLAEAGDDWLFDIVPAVFGMGVMARKGSPGAAKVFNGLKPFTSSKLLAKLENNRIALYTHVLRMQYEAVAAADNADRMAEAISGQRHEIEELRAELARRDEAIAALTHEKEQLARELRDPLSVQQPNMGIVLHQLGRVAAKQLRKAKN
ncbi:class I SAM-dependent methyltransferase [Saccharothrix sp. HUAS TT1]|uniref:class I SAM-dependent methyltransferase n=1 Tax=unclassified Saccharothrix TaxID=2593673 RepID=UPI00345C3935